MSEKKRDEKMTKEKAIAKLNKLGAKIKTSNQVIYASKEGKRTIEIGLNPDGSCVTFAVIHGYDNGNQETERFFRNNLTAVIKCADWQ